MSHKVDELKRLESNLDAVGSAINALLEEYAGVLPAEYVAAAEDFRMKNIKQGVSIRKEIAVYV